MSPPRVCDRETAVVPWNDFAVEKKRIETAALRSGIEVETKIDPPRQHDRPIHVRLEIGDETWIIDDLTMLLIMLAKRAPLSRIAPRITPMRGLPSAAVVLNPTGRSRPRSPSVSVRPLTEIASKPALPHALR